MSQFIGVYREVLISAGVLRADNTVVSPDEPNWPSDAEEVVQTMARADVDYFWISGGKRFDSFEKPVAAGVTKRMRDIVSALNKAGFVVQKAKP